MALVPLLIRAWGVDGFGEWMSLAALASYVTYTNFGLVSTAGNEIVMAAAARDIDRAQSVFQMAVNVTLYGLLPIFAVLAALASLVPFASVMNLKVASGHDAFVIIALALAQLWFNTLKGIVAASLNASGYYGLNYSLGGAAKILEVGLIAVLLLGFEARFISVAVAITSIAAVELLIAAALSSRISPWAYPDLRVFDLEWLGTQVKPGLGFAAGIFSTQGILLQGPRVVLGALLGGEAVALYTVCGTAMRLMDQAVFLFAFPLEVEIARSTGRNDLGAAYRLVIVGTQCAWVALICVSCVLLLLGPSIFHVWTAGRIEFDYSVMVLFLVMSACTQVGRISGHALMGTNRMYGPGALMLPAALAALALGGLLCRSFGVDGMVVGAIVGEFLVAFILIGALTRWLGEGGTVFLRDLLDLRALGGYVGSVAGHFRRRA